MQHAVLNALQLLRFSESERHRLVVGVDALFARGSMSANPKVFEAVAHFLLEVAAEAKSENVALQWPAIDRRDFRNGFTKILETLKKTGALPAFLVIRRSCFDDCRGERYEQVMLALANYAVSSVMNNHSDYAPHIPPSQEILASADSLVDQFEELAVLRDEQIHTWINYGTRLSTDFTDALLEMDELSNTRKSLLDHPLTIDGDKYTTLEEIERIHGAKLKTVETLWQDTLSWITTNEKNMETIASVMEDRNNKHSLHGDHVRFEIPQELSEKFRHDMQMDRIVPYKAASTTVLLGSATADSNSNMVAGDLDLVAMTKLWDYSVRYIHSALTENLPQDTEKVNYAYDQVVANLSTLNEVHQESKIVRSDLDDIQADLNSSIEALKTERKSRLCASPQQARQAGDAMRHALKLSSLTLAPETPKLNLRDRLNKKGKTSPFRHPILPDAFMAATPVAVSSLRASVRAKLFDAVERPSVIAPARESDNGGSKPMDQTSKRASSALEMNRTHGTPQGLKNGVTPLRRAVAAKALNGVGSRRASPLSIDSPRPASAHMSTDTPDSHRKGKQSQRFPLRKKIPTKDESSKDLPKDKKSVISRNARPRRTVVDAVVDQIVQSVADASSYAAVPRGSPGDKKSVRFCDNESGQDPFSTLGSVAFHPRAEIARTPLKKLAPSSPTRSSPAPAPQQLTPEKQSVRKVRSTHATTLPRNSPSLTLRNATPKPASIGRASNPPGNEFDTVTWLDTEFGSMQEAVLLDEAEPDFMHQNDADLVNEVKMSPAQPKSRVQFAEHIHSSSVSSVSQDEENAILFAETGFLDMSLANPLDDMSFYFPPLDDAGEDLLLDNCLEDGDLLDEQILDDLPLDERLLDQQPLLEQPLDEQPLNEQSLNEQPVDEQILDEQILDEQILDEQLPDEQLLDEQLLDEQMQGEQVLDEQMQDVHMQDDPFDGQPNFEGAMQSIQIAPSPAQHALKEVFESVADEAGFLNLTTGALDGSVEDASVLESHGEDCSFSARSGACVGVDMDDDLYDSWTTQRSDRDLNSETHHEETVPSGSTGACSLAEDATDAIESCHSQQLLSTADLALMSIQLSNSTRESPLLVANSVEKVNYGSPNVSAHTVPANVLDAWPDKMTIEGNETDTYESPHSSPSRMPHGQPFQTVDASLFEFSDTTHKSNEFHDQIPTDQHVSMTDAASDFYAHRQSDSKKATDSSLGPLDSLLSMHAGRMHSNGGVNMSNNSGRAFSQFRLDSGVVPGPSDLSELIPGHPEMSSVVVGYDESPQGLLNLSQSQRSYLRAADVGFLEIDGSENVDEGVNSDGGNVFLEGFTAWDSAHADGGIDTCEFLGDSDVDLEEFGEDVQDEEKHEQDVSLGWLDDEAQAEPSFLCRADISSDEERSL
ncbi:HAUS augmin-like complex subunit 6 N-terminus-domain-containing protein [Chytriomyces cf. hyalinus JEL632]|nr:HAUS augmin-like complex subunit 6 N-terminus-domain-containing protein [Chytriomyces cf. hyalinus JEL632]